MACSNFRVQIVDHPWTAWSLVSALLDLFVAFLLLVGATLSYLTSKIVRVFGLNPPCFKRESDASQERRTLRRLLLCDLHSEKLCAPGHRFVQRSSMERSIGEACLSRNKSLGDENFNPGFDCLNCMEPSKLCFSRHSRFHGRKTKTCWHETPDLKEMRSGEMGDSMLVKNQVWCETHPRPGCFQCIRCDLSIERLSQQGSSKRKFDNVFLEGLPSADEISDDEDSGDGSEIGRSVNEREVSSKVFPEEVIPMIAPRYRVSEGLVLKMREDYFENNCVKVDTDVQLVTGVNRLLDQESVEPSQDGTQTTCYPVGDTVESTGDPEANSGFAIQQSGDFFKERTSRTEVSKNAEEGDRAFLFLNEGSLLKQEGSEKTSRCCPVVDYHAHHGGDFLEESNDSVEPSKAQVSPMETDGELDADNLREALNSEREVLNCAYLELEQERNASATAANEAIAMITRLQKEKAVFQMEARQYQRIAEEKTAFDQEAIALLKDILVKREAEKLALEKEVELYRRRLLKDRIGEWERRKIAVKEDEDFFVLENKEEPALCREGIDVLISPSEEEQDLELMAVCERDSTQGITDITKTDILSEKSSRKARLVSSDGKNVIHSFDLVSADNSFSHELLERQVENETSCRSGVPLSNHKEKDHNILEVKFVGGYQGTMQQGDIDDTYNISLRNRTSGFSEEGKNNSTDVCVELVPIMHHISRIGGSAMKERKVRRSRHPADDKWDFILERLWNLEQRVQVLNAKQSLEPDKYDCLREISVKKSDDENTEGLVKTSEETLCLTRQKNRNPGSKQCQSQRKLDDENTEGLVKTSEETSRKASKKNGNPDSKQGQSQRKSRRKSRVGAQNGSQYSKEWTINGQDCTTLDMATTWEQCSSVVDARDLPSKIYISKLMQGSVRDPSEEMVEIDKLGNRGEKQPTKEGSIPRIELLDTRVKTPDEPTKLLGGRRFYSMADAESPWANEKEASTDEDNWDSQDASADELPRTVSSFDFRTASMVMRDNFRMVVEEEVQKLTWRLQALEVDREFIGQTIDSIKQEREEMELLQEIAQQLRKLHTTMDRSKVEEGYQQLRNVSSMSAFKGILSFTSLGYTILALLNNLSNLLLRSLNAGMGCGEHIGMCQLPVTPIRFKTPAFVAEDMKAVECTLIKKILNQDTGPRVLLPLTVFDWLQDEKGRAGTALAGWDY